MWYNNNNFESFLMLFINTPTHNMLKALDTMCHLHKGARSPKTNNCMLMHQSQQLEIFEACMLKVKASSTCTPEL